MTSPNDSSALPHERPSARSRLAKLSTAIAIKAQRRSWGNRAETWDRHNDFGMAKVANKAMESVDLHPGMDCVDLGCGTGRLALRLAEGGANVIGVDLDAAMIGRLQAQAAERGLDTVRSMITPIERLRLPSSSVDLVITNYALHHLLDADKESVVRSAFDWLRPGGQLVVADMMLGRGTSARDREIIVRKVRIMAKKGLPGYWRILKNAGRFLFRLKERPITSDSWNRLFESAGFDNIECALVAAEAAVVTGVKPDG